MPPGRLPVAAILSFCGEDESGEDQEHAAGFKVAHLVWERLGTPHLLQTLTHLLEMRASLIYRGREAGKLRIREKFTGPSANSAADTELLTPSFHRQRPAMLMKVDSFTVCSLLYT